MIGMLERVSQLLDLAALWVVVSYFTGAIRPEPSWRNAVIVVVGTQWAGLLSTLWLSPGLRPLEFAVQLAVLFCLTSFLCDTDQRTNLKILGWYLLLGGLIRSVCYLMHPFPPVRGF